MSGGWCRASIYRGGRLSTVAFEGLSRPPGGRSAQIGGVRGVVRGFSRASRRRLLRRMATVNRLAYKTPPAFITLTYPERFPEDIGIVKAHLRAFLKRLRRKTSCKSVVWRLEWQRRGAPHFHILAFGEVPSTLSVWLSRQWFEIVGSGDVNHFRYGCDLRQPHAWEQVTGYLAKYMSKVEDEGSLHPANHGRVWGIEGGKHLQIEGISFLLSVAEGVRIKRIMRKFAKHRMAGSDPYTSYTCFLGEDTMRHLISWQGATPIAMNGLTGLPPPLRGVDMVADGHEHVPARAHR